jgi:hypothetical protein
MADDLVEKNQTEVTIHDIDVLALTLLVDFSYTGEIVITEDNVQVPNSSSSVLTGKFSNKKVFELFIYEFVLCSPK